MDDRKMTPPQMSRSGDSSGGVQVIERAARILRALADAPDGLSLSELAGRAELARSTVHRLIGALQAERFVVAASPNGRVKLGPGLASLAVTALPDLVRDLHPHLASLSREMNETVDLSVLQHDHVLFVDQVAAPRRLRAVSAVGASFPAHCPAPGKVLLAALPDGEIERLLPPRLEQLTPRTIGSRDELLAELAEVRRAGVAFDREEHTLGICGVGCLVRDPAGRAASISVPMPAQRFYGHEQELASALLGAAKRIDAVLAAV
jgi:DNA-binding IclR family transcriptional regulator